MGTRRSFIKTDYDQRTTFDTGISLFSQDLEVELDVEEGEAVKLDMFASTEIRAFTQVVSNAIFLGMLFGPDIGTPPLVVERVFIPPAAQLSTWDASLNISWIVEPTTPGTKTYTFTIMALAPENFITVNARGLNAIAFQTNQQ
ncbi:hypothetical protein SAMN05192534_10994 [Alteribacillus persepolensis]|uniref:Uncharacterized protein n=1 Tax=Alteribacillus persepolensis TaxID=568899 RepID=A0A1G8EH49_9BACI|nr:hypothetical protein [Alteribacillus persepolensis]SDH69171.1 hypothetical protein SAMN05192534_10994 [Alteribacillus persepolensis]